MQVQLKQFVESKEASESLQKERTEQDVIQAAIARDEHMAALKKAETQSELSYDLSIQCKFKDFARKEDAIAHKIN